MFLLLIIFFIFCIYKTIKGFIYIHKHRKESEKDEIGRFIQSC